MGFFDKLFAGSARKKQWLSASGKDFSEIVNKKIVELEKAGYGPGVIEEIKTELKTIIKREGSKDEWIENDIDRQIRLKIQMMGVERKVFSDRLIRIERQYSEEEQEYFKFYENEIFNTEHGHPVKFDTISGEFIKHLRVIGTEDTEIDKYKDTIKQKIESSQKDPNTKPIYVLQSMVRDLKMEISSTRTNRIKAGINEEYERRIAEEKDPIRRESLRIESMLESHNAAMRAIHTEGTRRQLSSLESAKSAFRKGTTTSDVDKARYEGRIRREISKQNEKEGGSSEKWVIFMQKPIRRY